MRSENSLICGNCSNEVPNGWKFCNVCGNKLVASSAEIWTAVRENSPFSVAVPQEEQIEHEVPTRPYSGPFPNIYKKRKLLLFLTLAMITVVILAAVLK